MDGKITLVCYNIVKNNLFLNSVTKSIVRFSSVFFKLVYLVEALILLINRNESICLFLFIPFIVLIISKVIQKLFKRSRPFISLNIEPLVPHRNSGSMPSTHSASSMIISLVSIYISFPVCLCLIFLALLTGVTRIFSALHYPSDVLCGFGIALLFFPLIILL